MNSALTTNLCYLHPRAVFFSFRSFLQLHNRFVGVKIMMIIKARKSETFFKPVASNNRSNRDL